MNSYDAKFTLLIILVLLALLSPAIILTIIGLVKRKSKPELAKILFIIAVVYVLIGAGICGALLNA